MIENDNQLEVTLNAISKFATSIANLANVDRIGTTTNDKLKGVRVVQLLSNHQLEQLNQLRQTDMYEALDTLSNWVQAMNNNNDVPDELQAVYDRVWEIEKHNIKLEHQLLINDGVAITVVLIQWLLLRY